MSRVRAQIDIPAPIDVVFDFFDDLANAALLVPSFEEITAVETLPSGGRRVDYTFRDRRGGLREASSEQVVYDPPARTVTRNVQSGVATTMTRAFEVVGGFTRVTATVGWEIPVRSLSWIIAAPLRGPYRRALRHALGVAYDTLTEV